MKKIILIIFAITIYNSRIDAQTGWQNLMTGSTAYLTSLYFNDTLTGYIGGQNGFLAKTTNGGLNWTALSSGMATGFIRRIEFLNFNTGYLCGDNGNIRKTTNGGMNWFALSPGTSSTIASLTVADEFYVYACANNGSFLKSTDAGSTWNSVTVSTTKQLLAIDSRSRDTVFISGTGGSVYKSINGGTNWDSLYTGTLNNFWDIFTLDNNSVYAAAYYGTIRNTFDGGRTFISSYGNNINFEGIFMSNKMVGYTCGLSGIIMKTINGGGLWTAQNSNTTQGINEIFFLNSKTGYAVLSNGSILKTTDGGDNFNLAVVYPNGKEIWTSGTTNTIKWSAAIGGNVRIEYTTNNGTSWTVIQNSVPMNNFQYDWSVPVLSSSLCKVRITSIENPSLTDESNQLFSIFPSGVTYYNVPEILYYKFNNGVTTTPNYAVPGEGMSIANITGHTLQNGGLADSALIGGGGTGSDHFVNTNWATFLPRSGWTIGFWVSNISLGITTTNPVYLFGDVNANNFRCYYGGSGGIGSTDTAIMFRCTGMSDVRIPVVKGLTYYIHIVFDSSASAIKVYKNGTISLTIPQTYFPVLGNGPFLVGAHATFASSLAQDMKLDEFRIYNRALDQNEISQTWNITLPSILTGIENNNESIPERLMLYQNYPNPFNPKSKIKYLIPVCHSCEGRNPIVVLNIYDVLGKEVITLVNEQQKPGTYEIEFDGINYPSGVYFYELTVRQAGSSTGDFRETKKMILIK